MPLLLVRNDITKVAADAIVNPANTQLLQGSGTSRAIFTAAGEKELTDACKRIGHCDLGKAVITDGYALDADYVIHAVCPAYSKDTNTEGYLYSAYQESMILAERYHCHSIAFPLLSAGNYGYPKDLAFKIATNAIRDFLMDSDMDVYLVLYDQHAMVVGQKLFSDIQEYIDDNYVDENDETYDYDELGDWGDESYGIGGYGGNVHPRETVAQRRRRLAEIERERRERYEREGYEKSQIMCDEIVPEADTVMHSHTAPQPMLDASKDSIGAAPQSLDDMFAHMDETFSTRLLRLIDKTGEKDSVIYKAANVSRQHFSKIRNDEHYAPKKNTVFAFALALHLNLDDTLDLLSSAGYSLSRSSKTDVIIRYFIEHKMYDIIELNEVLYEYGLPCLQ